MALRTSARPKPACVATQSQAVGRYDRPRVRISLRTQVRRRTRPAENDAPGTAKRMRDAAIRNDFVLVGAVMDFSAACIGMRAGRLGARPVQTGQIATQRRRASRTEGASSRRRSMPTRSADGRRASAPWCFLACKIEARVGRRRREAQVHRGRGRAAVTLAVNDGSATRWFHRPEGGGSSSDEALRAKEVQPRGLLSARARSPQRFMPLRDPAAIPR